MECFLVQYTQGVPWDSFTGSQKEGTFSVHKYAGLANNSYSSSYTQTDIVEEIWLYICEQSGWK